MRKTRKALATVLALVLVLGILAGCGGPTMEVPSASPSQSADPSPSQSGNSSSSDPTPSAAPAPELTYAPTTVLRMATGYNNTKTGLTFDPDVAGEGLKLIDGNTYHAGDFKPTWVEVMNVLQFSIEDKYTGNSDSKEFDYWKEKLDQVDMLNGTATQFTEFGVAGSIVNIAEYLDMMPNFKAYLEANPIVYMSIAGDSEGAIYFSPYFDGVDDIERMPLMRTDWVAKLLDGEGEFTAAASKSVTTGIYTPYMPTSGKVAIDVVEPDGVSVKTIEKNYDKAGNIVENMNKAGSLDGVAAVNMLRKYIDEAYGGYYGTTRSNLFCGQNAAWDADELVALLRCVVANPQTLNGTDTIQGIFSREDNNNQRRVDMFRFAATLFGVRGLESRYNWMYIGTDGQIHDCRMDAETYQAMERMNAMVQEGLISQAFVDTAEEKTETYLANDLGFMHYDYNQTQTIYNENGKLQEGEKYMAAMVPVARWYDGTDPNGVYMRFTESWRSVKTGGWGISKEGVGDDQDKLYACLKLIDYAYSPEGQILMSYGPAAWRSDKTFLFNGVEMPEISDAAREELWTLGKGNYTNYARQYLGSTLSFMKSQAFEYQCTTAVGREGAGYISNAIAAGTIKHPILGVVEENMWYTSCPTVLPLTQTDNSMINSYTDLGNERWGVSKDQQNALLELITGGYAACSKLIPGASDAKSAAKVVSDTFSGAAQEVVLNDAWSRSLQFYNSIK